MKKILLVLVCSLMFGCGKDGSNGSNGFDGAPGIPGTPGQDGSDGSNGHSIVAQAPGTLPIICTNGGSAVDLYLDMDYDLTVSGPDVFQSTVFACNGLNGVDGTDGIDGQDGVDGVDGIDGQDGADGVDGIDGQDGADGADGQDGQDGADGATGPQGPAGPQGPQGPAGGWSGSVTAVNFPSDTTCRALGGGYYARKQNASSDSVRIYLNVSCSGGQIQELAFGGNEVYWTSVSNIFSIEGNNASGITVYRIIIQ